eukprot:4782918-Pleurochrysis_carterae.AAC.1
MSLHIKCWSSSVILSPLASVRYTSRVGVHQSFSSIGSLHFKGWSSSVIISREASVRYTSRVGVLQSLSVA